MWLEVWSQSIPMPAHRQKRLFDDTKEAEKVLHFLAALKPSDVVTHLLPVVVQAALERIEEAGQILLVAFIQSLYSQKFDWLTKLKVACV